MDGCREEVAEKKEDWGREVERNGPSEGAKTANGGEEVEKGREQQARKLLVYVVYTHTVSWWFSETNLGRMS